MGLRTIGPITSRCQYCTAWERDEVPDEHYHVLKLDYDNTCDTITFCVDGRVMFVIDLADWEKIHKPLQEMI